MAKFKAGIPDNFTLNVPPVDDLGDYLDEPSPRPPPVRRPAGAPRTAAAEGREVPTPPPPVAARTMPAAVARVDPEPPPRDVPSPTPLPGVPTPDAGVNDDRLREERGGRPKAPRREITMSPETLTMSDELLELIRKGSGQRDTKANELFHALVMLAYEARDEINVHALPKRGRWGTPTARAYPLEVKNALLQAVLKKAASAG